MKMKYFLPDWEDRLDPGFNFEKDQFSKEHKKNPYQNDFYAHQFFEKSPYDGILVSLGIFEKKIALGNNGDSFQIRGCNDIKEYLKIPEDSNLEVMGDCGAFSYVKEKSPPKKFYNTKNIANLYNELKFHYGVSVDHLAVDYIFIKNQNTGKRFKKTLSQKEKDNRVKITLKNAKEFIKLHKNMNYDFIPIGVAQGYDLKSYKSSVKAIVDMGYENIAIGSLVNYKTEFILKILEEIQPYIRNINVHLFGVLRPEYLKRFKKLGVTSFDSASFFRKAWLRSGQNYLCMDGKWYSAIRVPQSKNPRILKYAELNGFSNNEIEKMERKALNALFKYEKKTIELEDALNTILEYDALLLRSSDNGNLREKYKKTLLDRPWEKCNCEFCKDIGINVVIFRGTNRNKRRGFHNLWAFRNSENISQQLLNI